MNKTPVAPVRALGGLALMLICACGSNRDGLPQVREIYREAARREARNPVVVIHGILGSRLVHQESGKVVWGAFTDEGIDPDTPEGARMLSVEVPGPEGAMDYDPRTAAVRPSGPLGALDVGLFFGVLSVEVYAGILKTLGVGGYTDPVGYDPETPEYSDEHFTCFTYFYDWRRDNVENAVALGRYLKDTRATVERDGASYCARLRELGDAASLAEAQEVEDWLASDWKFDVVAHSMGGLVARYFLRYGMNDLPTDGSEPEVTWAGAEEIDRLVLVGTPSLGAMDSFQRLIEGFELAFFLPHYHQAVLGTMPAIYQLLPRTSAGLLRREDGSVADVDLFDAQTWERNGWGVMDPESEEVLSWLLPEVAPELRRPQALAYLQSCLDRAKAFHRSLDKDAEMPSPTEMRLFASDSVMTPSGAILEERDGRLRPRFGVVELPGDETVPRYSALADRRFGSHGGRWIDSPIPWTSVTFIPDDHVGLTSNPVFTNNLLHILLEQEPVGRRGR